MPHVIVKTLAAQSEQQKRKLADEITRAVMSTLHYARGRFRVGIEEVNAKDWTERIYSLDMLAKRGTIYKEPGYAP